MSIVATGNIKIVPYKFGDIRFPLGLLYGSATVTGDGSGGGITVNFPVTNFEGYARPLYFGWVSTVGSPQGDTGLWLLDADGFRWAWFARNGTSDNYITHLRTVCGRGCYPSPVLRLSNTTLTMEVNSNTNTNVYNVLLYLYLYSNAVMQQGFPLLPESP